MHRKIGLYLTVMLSFSLADGIALAESNYPEKSIEALVAYAAGAGVDVAARAVAEGLTKYLKQPVVIVNKPGGSGAIAGNALAKAKADGYTIGMFNPGQPTPECNENPENFVYKTGDLRPVAQYTTKYAGIFVKYDDPWKSAGELVEYAKKNPAKLKWGHNGHGGMFWINGSLFAQSAGIKMLDIPFQGDGENLAALLGNHINMAVLSVAAGIIDQLAAKKIRALFVAAPERCSLLPDVPSANEVGYPTGSPVYNGIFVPKGTPENVVSKLTQATQHVTQDGQFKEKFEKLYLPVDYRNIKDFERAVNKFGEFRCEVLKMLGAK